MKHKMKIVFSFFSIVLMLLLGVSGCSSSQGGSTNGGGSGGKKVQLTMSAWGNPAELKVYQKAIDAFNQQHADIQVKLVPIPSDGYQQKILTQLSGGKAPDVFYVGSEWISQLIKNGSVVNLTEFLSSSESYSKPEEFSEGLWGAARKDGQIYGVPVDCNPALLYYNKKVLKEAGVKSPQEYFDEGKWNWDTFTEVTGKLRDAGKYGFVAENNWFNLFSWVWTNGGQLYDDNGNIILDQNEKAQEAIRYLDKMIDQKNFIYAGSLPKGQGPDAMFMSNQVGFVAAGRWLTPMFSENKSLEFDYIPWPTNTGNKTEPAAVATAYLAANKDSKYVKEAMKFLSFYVSQEGQKARLSGNGNAVPSINGIENIVVDAGIPEHAQYLIDARNIGLVDDKQSVVPGMDKEVNDIMDLMYLNKKNADETIKAVTEKVKTMTENYRNSQ